MRKVYEAAGIKAEVSPFFKDIARRISEAHLVISRAGASSIADISVIGRPSILIPFAAATGDHQTANARGLVDADAAILVPETALDPASLSEQIMTVLTTPGAALRMRDNARLQGKPDANRTPSGPDRATWQERDMNAAAATKLPTEMGPIHFVGIGGIGMSGIAEVLIEAGYRVQGSDLKRSKITDRLEQEGRPHIRGPGAGEPGSGRGHRHFLGHQTRQSRVGRGAPSGSAGRAPGRDAGRTDAAQVEHRRGRNPRQDDHDDHGGRASPMPAGLTRR